MPTVTDLTFDLVNDAAIADATIGEAVFSFSADTVLLDVKKLTGDTFTAITDRGVLEMSYKLRKLLGEAQILANTTFATTPEEELISFPIFTFGFPSADGNVEVTQVSSYLIPLGVDSIKGVN